MLPLPGRQAHQSGSTAQPWLWCCQLQRAQRAQMYHLSQHESQLRSCQHAQAQTLRPRFRNLRKLKARSLWQPRQPSLTQQSMRMGMRTMPRSQLQHALSNMCTTHTVCQTRPTIQRLLLNPLLPAHRWRPQWCLMPRMQRAQMQVPATCSMLRPSSIQCKQARRLAVLHQAVCHLQHSTCWWMVVMISARCQLRQRYLTALTQKWWHPHRSCRMHGMWVRVSLPTLPRQCRQLKQLLHQASQRIQCRPMQQRNNIQAQLSGCLSQVRCHRTAPLQRCRCHRWFSPALCSRHLLLMAWATCMPRHIPHQRRQ